MKQPDYTFWTRMISFIEKVQVNDLMSDEEQEYLIYVGKQQLEQQFANSFGEEREYLIRCHNKFFKQ